MGHVAAHVCEAQLHLGRLVQDKIDAIRQAEDMSRAVEMVKSRPVRVRAGCGQWVCQGTRRANDLQPSGGRGRLRWRDRPEKLFDSVPERVNMYMSMDMYMSMYMYM